MGKLYEHLMSYVNQEFYPFHMPGHKRNTVRMEMENPFKFDITEIEEFDNLHHPKEILREIMEDAAQFYGSRKTYFLVNGSTCGVLSAIAAVTKPGGKLLIARNSHKSAYNAMYLGRVTPVYVYPEVNSRFGTNGILRPSDIEDILRENQDIMGVFITSPTYEGVVSDIQTISEIVHGYGIPLIVDEAHGAHFGMHDGFPRTATRLGADIIIQSIHKTLPSLTQTALLHMNGNRMSVKRLEKFLGIYQSSSPSYVLLSSIDSCISYLAKEGKKLFDDYFRRLVKYRTQIDGLEKIRLLKGTTECYDISKIVLSVKGTDYTGVRLYYDLLNEYHIQAEMASADYVILMTSCMDTEEGFLGLINALKKIEKKIKKIPEDERPVETVKAILHLSITEALEKDTEAVPIENALGKICAEYMYLYPPGIPIAAPGEMITGEVIRVCRRYEKAGLSIQGLESDSLNSILIIRESKNGG